VVMDSDELCFMAVVMGGGGKVPCLSCFSFLAFTTRHSLVVLRAHIRARRIRIHDTERDTKVTNTGMLNTLHSFGLDRCDNLRVSSWVTSSYQ